MRKKLFTIVASGIWLGVIAGVLYPQESTSYQVVEVVDGGSIEGVVKYAGAVPEPKKLKVDKDQSVCATDPKFSEELIVSRENKGIRNVVVSIIDINKGNRLELPATNPQLDQRNCTFQPHVQIVPVGITLEILNNDGILHNVHTYSIKNQSFNKAQPKFKKKMTAVFEHPEIIKVACDAHMWMSAWLVISEHPYYALTGADGSFKIADVPPGTYQLQYWQEKLGKQTVEVTVKAKAKTTADIEHKEKTE